MYRLKIWRHIPDARLLLMVAGAAFIFAVDLTFLIQHLGAHDWPLFASRAMGLLVLALAIVLFIYSDGKLKMAIRMMLDTATDRAAAEAAETPTLMPIIQLDEDGRFVGLTFPTIDIPSGKAVFFAVPRIPGVGRGKFKIAAEGGYERTMVIDFDEGVMVEEGDPEGKLG